MKKEKRIGRRILSVLLVLVLCNSFVTISFAQSKTGNFNRNYTLTGNGATDMVNIAFAQKGKTGSNLGYTEQWCADFVSDCAILSGQQAAIPASCNVGVLANNILNAGGWEVSKANARKGDVAIYDWTGTAVDKQEHVEIVYSEAGNPVATIGGNTGGKSDLYSRCVAVHNTDYDRSRILKILRPNYKGGSPTSPPVNPFNTKYAGDYKVITQTDPLLIRSGPGTSYSRVGSIPKGATVYVSEATGTSADDWAHVNYNGVSGYSSMQYLELVSPATYTNTIYHWLWGFQNGEGNDDSKKAFLIRTTTFERQQNSNFVLDASSCAALPNGTAYVGEFSTPSIDDAWGNYSFGTTVSQKPFTMSFYYPYVPIDYAITYDLAGGKNNTENPATYNVLYGVTLREPTREGYTFNGWYNGPTRATGINQGKNAAFVSADDLYAQLAKRQTGDIRLTASWTANTYTVVYSANGGTGAPASQTKTHGEDLTLSAGVPTRENYKFLGWATASDATEAEYQPGGSFTADENTTLYAVWKAHDYKAVLTPPTCTEQGYTTHTCARCGDSYKDNYVPALGHDWGEWVVTKQPTATENGEEIRTCSRCGKAETRLAPHFLLGDVNLDGMVDAGDAVLVLRHDAQIIGLTGQGLANADTNRDGIVDAGDAVPILRLDAGLIDEL